MNCFLLIAGTTHKTSGGTQGRETKTKSTKKKFRADKRIGSDGEEDNISKDKNMFEFLSVEEVNLVGYNSACI